MTWCPESMLYAWNGFQSDSEIYLFRGRWYWIEHLHSWVQCRSCRTLMTMYTLEPKSIKAGWGSQRMGSTHAHGCDVLKSATFASMQYNCNTSKTSFLVQERYIHFGDREVSQVSNILATKECAPIKRLSHHGILVHVSIWAWQCLTGLLSVQLVLPDFHLLAEVRLFSELLLSSLAKALRWQFRWSTLFESAQSYRRIPCLVKHEVFPIVAEDASCQGFHSTPAQVFTWQCGCKELRLHTVTTCHPSTALPPPAAPAASNSMMPADSSLQKPCFCLVRECVCVVYCTVL